MGNLSSIVKYKVNLSMKFEVHTFLLSERPIRIEQGIAHSEIISVPGHVSEYLAVYFTIIKS